MSASAVWDVVHQERRRLVADLSGLTAAQWLTPSLCPGWDVHDVVAHLVDTARTSRLRFVRGMVAARLDFDRANAAGIAREKRPDPSATLNALREAVGLKLTPPANLTTRLVEAIVHGEDIRRALGLTGTYPGPAVVEALTYQLRTPVGFGGGRERAEGRRLVDRHTGEAWGEGPQVEGDALDLLLAISGRPVPPGSLTGAGTPGFGTVLREEELWGHIHAERAALAEDLAGLSPQQWRHSTLCGLWDVEEVVAHLVAGASLNQWQWLRSIVGARFRPDVHNQRRMVEHRGTDPSETLERFRAVSTSRTLPSNHLAAYLGEVVVHAQDIRQPLGLSRTPGVEALTPVAEFFASRDFTVNSRKLVAGLELRAEDGPFRAGSGPLVTGSTLALVMAMAGRPPYLGELDGPGAPILRGRTPGR